MEESQLGMEETYSERINLVFGKGIDVVATHAKHGDLDTKREIYIKIKRKKKKKKIDGHEMEGNENGFRKMMEDILILCDCDIVCLFAC